jgi:hypothetical protein
MNYSSPFCPDDAEVFTTNGKMKISKLYYKMNPKRDPYNRILDIQNLFLSKCISTNINKNNEDEKQKLKKDKNLKELKDINEYYNNISKKNFDIVENTKYQFSLNQEEVPYFNDYSSIFQTSIKINNTNYKSKNISCSDSKFNNSKINMSNINSKGTSNIINNSSNNNEQSKSMFNKPKILTHSHSYVVKLDKTYYKSPTLNKKILVLNHKNKKFNNLSRFSLSNNSSYYFNDSDMATFNEFNPFAKQNYLNGQFDFDLSKTKALGQLKQYQIKETQNRNKVKPFVY